MSETVSETWTVRRVLDWTRTFFTEKGLESPRLDAELLVADALGYDRMKLYMHPGQPLTADELTAIRERVQRRARREPVAYITGTRGFWTIDLAVDPRVLVPRPETEGLVELALARLRGERLPAESRPPGEVHVELIDFGDVEIEPEVEQELDEDGVPIEVAAVVVEEPAPEPSGPVAPPPVVVDVGTGSGCIALAIASAHPTAEVFAIDRSVGALAVAMANAETLGLSARVRFSEGNVLTPRPPKPADMVVSNPPYIASAEVDRLMPDVRDHEPRAALDGGPDGLMVIRPLVDQAAQVLKPGGHLLIEIGYDQGPVVKALIEADGRYARVVVHPDLAGHDRYVEAVRA